jgi:hypothetical protein
VRHRHVERVPRTIRLVEQRVHVLSVLGPKGADFYPLGQFGAPRRRLELPPHQQSRVPERERMAADETREHAVVGERRDRERAGPAGAVPENVGPNQGQPDRGAILRADQLDDCVKIVPRRSPDLHPPDSGDPPGTLPSGPHRLVA